MDNRERSFWPPPDDLYILDWVERKQYLSARSEETGPIRIDRTPYIRPWLEAAVDDSVEEIVICASAQVAKTTFGLSVAGYYADILKAPVLFCMADENTAKKVSRDKVRKLFEDSPELQWLIDGAPVKNADEIELANGGYVGVAWASSVAALATREFRVTIADEIDKKGYYLKSDEATPLSLIRERTESFYTFKHIFFSTPTIESGNITVELSTCDVIFDWHVPCPLCGVRQPLRFSPEHAFGFKDGKYRDIDGKMRPLGRVVWDGGSSATAEQIRAARYECGSCKGHWTTAMKNRAVMFGESVSRSEAPAEPKKVGFHINRLYSLLGKSGHLDRLVDSFLKAKRSKDQRKLQGVINSSFGEPFLPAKKIRKADVILKLADKHQPRGIVPGGGVVSCLLAAADTQDDGFPYEIRAFGFGIEKSSWGIRSGFAPTLSALKQILWQDEYKDADGNRYHVHLGLIDAMGHRTSEVYDFCRMHRGAILPTMGKQTMQQPFRYSEIEYYPGTKQKILGGLSLVLFDTNYFKNQLSTSLEVVSGDPGAWMFNADLTEDWAEQMTAEFINEKGLWECPEGKANHAWDVSTLLLLAHEILGVSFWPDPSEIQAQQPTGRRILSSGIS